LIAPADQLQEVWNLVDEYRDHDDPENGSDHLLTALLRGRRRGIRGACPLPRWDPDRRHYGVVEAAAPVVSVGVVSAAGVVAIPGA
jgi:hypothetical protein